MDEPWWTSPGGHVLVDELQPSATSAARSSSRVWRVSSVSVCLPAGSAHWSKASQKARMPSSAARLAVGSDTPRLWSASVTASASLARFRAERSCSSVLPAMTGRSLAPTSRRSSVKVAVRASRAARNASSGVAGPGAASITSARSRVCVSWPAKSTSRLSRKCRKKVVLVRPARSATSPPADADGRGRREPWQPSAGTASTPAPRPAGGRHGLGAGASVEEHHVGRGEARGQPERSAGDTDEDQYCQRAVYLFHQRGRRPRLQVMFTHPPNICQEVGVCGGLLRFP